MKKDSKVSDVLHILLHMADQNEPLTSSALARMIQTNPVVIRRTLSGLREKGLVGSASGRTGGWTLTCELSKVTLLDIYKAVGEPTLFAIGKRNESPGCLVEKNVNEVLSDSFKEAEALLFEHFSKITLQTLCERFSRDMTSLRASLDKNEKIA